MGSLPKASANSKPPTLPPNAGLGSVLTTAGCASWLDTDGDGVISLDELRAVFGDELTETQLLELLSKADQDGDGVVTPADVNEAARKVRERQ